MGRRDFRAVKGVRIANVLLDVENARIRAGTDQADCIARILRKEDQLLALMEDIAVNGLSTVPILVSRGPSRGTWIVKDGNRRVTALKLLNDPNLCPDARLKPRIKALAKAHHETIEGAVDVLASDDPEAIIREVVSRHSGAQGGVGQLDWSAYLRTIYLLHHGHPSEYKRAAQYVFWAEEQGIAVEDEFPITTVHRFFTAENLKGLGFKVEHDELTSVVTPAAAKAMAQRVITDFQRGASRGGKSVDDVRKPELAKLYIDEVRVEAGLPPTTAAANNPAPTAAAKKGGSSSGATTPAPAPGGSPAAGAPAAAPAPSTSTTSPAPPAAPTPKQSPSERPKVLGRSPNLSIPESERKACTIVTELRKLDVRDTPLAAAGLLCHLIELSDGRFRAKHNLGEKGYLHKNMLTSANHMRNSTWIDQSQFDIIERLVRSGHPDLLHIETLQKIMHRDTHHPTYQLINGLWDNVATFVRTCWTR